MPGLKSVKVFQPEPKFEGYGAGAQGAWVGCLVLPKVAQAGRMKATLV